MICEVRIKARPETIFPFFTDPELLLRWKGVSCEIEPRAGGLYRCNVNGNDVAEGEYVAVEPHSRVVFTWGWVGSDAVPPGSSTVEITLTPDGDSTLVRLTHRDLPAPEAEAQHEQGWLHYLARLAIAAPGGDAGPDPMVGSSVEH